MICCTKLSSQVLFVDTTFIKIHGHQLLENNLFANPREEALTFDKHALSLYKNVDGKDILVGHIPKELSQLLSYFLSTDSEKRKTLKAEVIGRRKREIGLAVPAKYTAMTNDKKFAEVLLQQLEEKKKIIAITITERVFKKFPCFEGALIRGITVFQSLIKPILKNIIN